MNDRANASNGGIQHTCVGEIAGRGLDAWW
jgi:hypothetical protein